MKIAVGFYGLKSSNKEFKELFLDKTLKKYEFYTNGSARSSDNDFDKNRMLISIYEICGDYAICLINDREYRLPYVMSVETSVLEGLKLRKINNKRGKNNIPPGQRGRSHIDVVIEYLRKEGKIK